MPRERADGDHMLPLIGIVYGGGDGEASPARLDDQCLGAVVAEKAFLADHPSSLPLRITECQWRGHRFADGRAPGKQEAGGKTKNSVVRHSGAGFHVVHFIMGWVKRKSGSEL